MAAYTKHLSPEALADATAVAFAPLVYQARIDRTLDVRTVVVGTDIFSAGTASSEDGLDDIRRVPLAEARYEAIALPDEARSGLRQLMTMLELEYISADFAVSENGDWYFLDLNATGAFLWVEKLAGFPISARIAEYLAVRR